MPRFRHREHDLYYEVIGEGTPLALIHGFTNHGFAWVPQLNDLVSTGHKVILLDLPCHGRSKSVQRTVTVPEMADLIVDLMDFLSIDQFSACGLSLGGMIVQTLLIRHLGRIKRAIIANSSSNFASDGSRSAVEGWKQVLRQNNGAAVRLEKTWGNLVSTEFQNTAFAQAVYQSWLLVNQEVDGNGLANVADGMLQFDSRPGLTSVNVPALLIGGRQDRLIPLSEMEYIHSQLKNSKLMILEQAGHLSNLDSPADFNRALVDFLMS